MLHAICLAFLTASKDRKTKLLESVFVTLVAASFLCLDADLAMNEKFDSPSMNHPIILHSSDVCCNTRQRRYAFDV